MMATDGLAIHCSARLWHELHGDRAVPKAREMAQAFQAKGDAGSADASPRIIVAIEELRRRVPGEICALK